MKVRDYLKIEDAADLSRTEVGRLGTAVLFIVGVMIYTGTQFADVDRAFLLVAAAVIGAYMALNIGANDVANNVGPAVGSFAITLTSAILIAVIFEASGAIIAGGDVVETVKKGIIDPARVGNTDVFVWVMMGALMGAAIWLNAATWLGAPVSTTHSIVGGVMGAGIASAGWDIVNWTSMAQIAASWVISPLMGGVIAATILYALKKLIFFQSDPVSAARKVVPFMNAIMAWVFTTYLALKGIKHLVKLDTMTALFVGAAVAVLCYVSVRPFIVRATQNLSPDRSSVNRLFTVPLIFAAALLSFAHGANDVANAVGPLAGVVDVLTQGGGGGKVAIPMWVMVIGAIGISFGLALFGPKLIRTVGSEITELDRSRAFCIALAAAVTVIIASQLGLPISSTHVALGAVFGVGFLREFLEQRLGRVVENVLAKHEGDPNLDQVEAVLMDFRNAPPEEKHRMLDALKAMGPEAVISAAQRKKLRKALKRQLVKRSSLLKIASAWVITVPVSGALAALFFFALRGMMLP
ncbi:inorganic phosphate transporter, PiT family [Cohaesibacter sp. ES.047]|uniref:inorganic phosphate transporter n=1 Tax=Cohaesibacter sp. ES.047 TaxID=1798205 RepID=UPI000BB77892|nr:inorganic phosphate transporter [Cohaesibacter sp. ES.047]SNY92580.1 inorganic phosphate transporter, PiT family [Cohaesibacter sp. ES.047]